MALESTLKILDYISRVSKAPITVNGEPFGVPLVERVILTDLFFRKDDCHMCGKCCPNETTAWTKEGLVRMLKATPEDFTKWGLDPDVLKEIQERMQEQTVLVNNLPVTFFVSAQDEPDKAFRLEWSDRREQPRCHWLFEKDNTYRCRIHPVRSITCGLPHCRFIHNANTHNTSIGVSQFGRNWRLKCPVEFGYVDEASVQTRILWLERLNATAEDCGVETFLPEILEYLHAGNRSPAVFQVKPKRKLFTVR